MNHGLIARAVVFALALGVVGAGTAEAAPPPTGNAAFPRSGVAVYAEDAVGVGCRTFGFCSGIAAELLATATPRYLSARPNEAVLVTCRAADLARVVGFFGRGEDLITGWADASALLMRRDGRVPACGPLN
jgi:hypothetical protein